MFGLLCLNEKQWDGLKKNDLALRNKKLFGGMKVVSWDLIIGGCAKGILRPKNFFSGDWLAPIPIWGHPPFYLFYQILGGAFKVVWFQTLGGFPFLGGFWDPTFLPKGWGLWFNLVRAPGKKFFPQKTFPFLGKPFPFSLGGFKTSPISRV